jgi:SnoaL-like domain
VVRRLIGVSYRAELVEQALEAIKNRDWESLRTILHPYVRWNDGGTSIRGRTKVLAHLRAHPEARPPTSWEFRDGQIYRWAI